VVQFTHTMANKHVTLWLPTKHCPRTVKRFCSKNYYGIVKFYYRSLQSAFNEPGAPKPAPCGLLGLLHSCRASLALIFDHLESRCRSKNVRYMSFRRSKLVHGLMRNAVSDSSTARR
jgi:hypothetical protein